MILTLARLETPLGGFLVVSDAQGRLHASEYADLEPRLHRLLARRLGAVRLLPGAAPPELAAAMAAYFAGDGAALASVPVVFSGSAFQNAVWAALREIPAGATETYGQLAARLGHPGAARAVGLANGANPFEIVVPCHRVIGAGGKLTGYAGGLPRKRWLLRHEARQSPQAELFA